MEDLSFLIEHVAPNLFGASEEDSSAFDSLNNRIADFREIGFEAFFEEATRSDDSVLDKDFHAPSLPLRRGHERDRVDSGDVEFVCRVLKRQPRMCELQPQADGGSVGSMGQTKYQCPTLLQGRHARWTGKIAFDERALLKALQTKKPTSFFVNSMSDLLHEGVTDQQINRIFAVMALYAQHTFQVLTKRPAPMKSYLSNPTANAL